MSPEKRVVTPDQQSPRVIAIHTPKNRFTPLTTALAIALAGLLLMLSWNNTSISPSAADPFARFYKRVIQINSYLFDGVEETTAFAHIQHPNQGKISPSALHAC